jgi:hypothetical protein
MKMIFLVLLYGTLVRIDFVDAGMADLCTETFRKESQQALRRNFQRPAGLSLGRISFL